MTPFYRYIRPIKFNERRVELDTQLHGGICLRFEEYQSPDDSWVWFTYSRCRSDELFSKGVAKSIVDTRAKTGRERKQHLMGYLGKLKLVQGTDELTTQVINWCINWEPPEYANLTVQKYLRVEQLELGEALQELLAKNAQERQKAEIWKAGIAAADHVARYEGRK